MSAFGLQLPEMGGICNCSNGDDDGDFDDVLMTTTLMMMIMVNRRIEF